MNLSSEEMKQLTKVKIYREGVRLLNLVPGARFCCQSLHGSCKGESSAISYLPWQHVAGSWFLLKICSLCPISQMAYLSVCGGIGTGEACMSMGALIWGRFVLMALEFNNFIFKSIKRNGITHQTAHGLSEKGQTHGICAQLSEPVSYVCEAKLESVSRLGFHLE